MCLKGLHTHQGPERGPKWGNLHKSLKIVFSKTADQNSLKFCHNDTLVVLYQVCVFYGPTSIRGQIRGNNILHYKSMGKWKFAYILILFLIFLNLNDIFDIVSLQQNQYVCLKRLHTYQGPERGPKWGNLHKSLKIFFSKTADQNSLKFCHNNLCGALPSLCFLWPHVNQGPGQG